MFKGAKYNVNDKTMSNPMEWLYCKVTSPDSQVWTTDNNSYIRSEDKVVKTLA